MSGNTLKDKNRFNDRLVICRKMEGKNALSSSGLIDNRIFTGENNLHIIQGPDALWHFKYDHGMLEQKLKQKFTTFTAIKNFITDYMARRNIEVKEIINAPSADDQFRK